MAFALCAMLGMAAYAAGETYHVYKFQFNVKTTDGKGVTALCGCDEYAFREKRAVTIQGILAGCGCEAIQANGVCKNAILYMWDATRKLPIKNVEMTIPWTVQRVGKKATGIEHFAGMKATYGEDDRYSFEINMAGFGNYKESSKDVKLNYVSGIEGNFAGVATAPYVIKARTCTACYAEPDELFVTTAFETCVSCGEESLLEATYKDLTPFFGAYKVVYNASLSKSASKNGLEALVKSLPKYVSAEDYVATNIGE